jgi:plastocyanin
MKKALLVTCVAVTVLVAGCTTQDSADNNAPTTDNEPANTSDDGENVVRYSSSGFEPSTIRIEHGESVTWVRDGGPAMWVGSDQHPDHTNYDDTRLQEHCSNGNANPFDQCATGDEFTFTFEQTGEWDYHNHERPFHGGTVIVE